MESDGGELNKMKTNNGDNDEDDNLNINNSKMQDPSARLYLNSRNVSVTQNATNSHPLMYSPTSPISPDYPDLIPEKPKPKLFINPYQQHNNDELWFHPEVHSSPQKVGIESKEPPLSPIFKSKLKELPTLEEYNKQELPDYPESPSSLRKCIAVDVSEISDTENDKSIYEAHLSSNFQNVSMTMNEKEGNLNFLAHGKRSHKLRKVKIIPTENNDEEDNISDISSIDSNTDSLKSDDIFTNYNLANSNAVIRNTEEDDDEEEDSKSMNGSPEPIEPLSAADERKHARHWQRMVLPGGEQRTIDMRVIEPYKRVLSHGGYLRAGGHTAIVIFSACFLPDRSRVDYDYVMDNLFLYVLWTLERLVTDDYVLVYLHGGATRLPSFSWLKRCYQLVGRRLRKNLSHLYIVHPSLWIKTMLFMAKPFISAKFNRKITFINNLRELFIRVPLEAAAVPDKVKLFDSIHCSKKTTSTTTSTSSSST